MSWTIIVVLFAPSLVLAAKWLRLSYFQPVKQELVMVIENTIEEREFRVIHPLDDVVEQKVETTHLGSIRMIRAVPLSLLALRGYPMVMMLLVLYHVLDLAGAFGKL
ncbi:MAG: hypothetical protein ABSG03_07940 [Bryobacteraceae bacterium]